VYLIYFVVGAFLGSMTSVAISLAIRKRTHSSAQEVFLSEKRQLRYFYLATYLGAWCARSVRPALRPEMFRQCDGGDIITQTGYGTGLAERDTSLLGEDPIVVPLQYLVFAALSALTEEERVIAPVAAKPVSAPGEPSAHHAFMFPVALTDSAPVPRKHRYNISKTTT
jgi:hypothetical protein